MAEYNATIDCHIPCRFRCQHRDELLRACVYVKCPVAGTVLRRQPEHRSHPSAINEYPYNHGRLNEVRLKDKSEIASFMDMDEYYHFVLEPKSPIAFPVFFCSGLHSSVFALQPQNPASREPRSSFNETD